MGWFTSLFSFDSNQRARKGQALSSTHEAFSLPTSSPVFPSSNPDAFTPDSLNTPDPDGHRGQSYTYPPQSANPYGYVPSPLSASRPGSSTLLPTHLDPIHSQHQRNLYPPLAQTWNRLRVWLNREYPELGDTLNYGISLQDLQDLEMQFGISLPSAVRESYLCVDGQEAESAAGCSEGLFFGLTLLPLESVLEEWRFWREVDEDSNTGANPKLLELMQSIPPRWIRLEYSNRGWVPLIADKAGNYIGIDMDPAEEGSVGQVIIFGRDFDTKVVLWNGDGIGGWGKWLAAFVDELEAGETFEIGQGDNSEGSEDDVGYESYYHDGSGHGAGDGGGESGVAGGLKLIGEYRGWSVLEAWGDKSLRKWHEVGLLPNFPSYQQEPAESVGLGVFDGGAEIPAAEGESANQAPIASTSKSQPRHVPTISVSKAPAPRPVDLPTAQDIGDLDSSSPPESLHNFDLESGRAYGEQGHRDNIGLVSSSTGRSAREPTSPVPSAIPHPMPPPLETNHRSSDSAVIDFSDTTPTSKTPPSPIPDLMAESTPSIPLVPLEPSTSSGAQVNGKSMPEDENLLLDSGKAEGGQTPLTVSGDAPTATSEPTAETSVKVADDDDKSATPTVESPKLQHSKDSAKETA